jgi:rubredoxin
MVMRRCPECNAVWYSADSIGNWVCNGCGFVLPPELNEVANEL